ncbi:MAG: Smr/MutS family protein [Polyangiaceae bacterium]
MAPKKPAPPSASSPSTPFYRPFEAAAKEALKKVKESEEAARAAKAAKATSGAKKMVRTAPAASRAPAASSLPTENASFADLMFGVTPLQREGASRIPATQTAVNAPSTPNISPSSSDEAVRAHLRQLVEQGPSERFEIIDDGARIAGARADIDKMIFRRLRRGEFPIDAQCDLHGMNASEARALLETSVAKRRELRDRVLLVVHGRGRHSPRGDAILRGEISAWLSQGPASVHVDAFATARDEDGGEGATYVLLRRS